MIIIHRGCGCEIHNTEEGIQEKEGLRYTEHRGGGDAKQRCDEIHKKHRERGDKMKKTEDVEMQGRERIGQKILRRWGDTKHREGGDARQRRGKKHKTHRRW